MRASSSPTRRSRPSGSKVITDPGEPGPDLLELLVDGERFGHAADGSGAAGGRRRIARPQDMAVRAAAESPGSVPPCAESVPIRPQPRWRGQSRTARQKAQTGVTTTDERRGGPSAR